MTLKGVYGSILWAFLISTIWTERVRAVFFISLTMILNRSMYYRYRGNRERNFGTIHIFNFILLQIVSLLLVSDYTDHSDHQHIQLT